jgi:hypothetical protein
MTPPTDCTQHGDTLKLVREGTSQEQRRSLALDPAYAPVNEHRPEHGMVFTQAYSAFLQYYDSNNVAVDDWKRFFSADVSVQLAIAAIQDVEYYRQQVQAHFKALNDSANNVIDSDVETKLREHLGSLFSILGTLAWRLDDLKQTLPPEIRLKGALQNLIQSQLAPAFKLLLLYYRDGLSPDSPPPPDAPYLNDVESPFSIMGAKTTFKNVRSQGLSTDWIAEETLTNWGDYLGYLDDRVKNSATKIFGSENTLFKRINHIATHNLFTSIFDQFLKAYARVVNDAKLALEDTFTKWDGHDPHYALFLAFLRLFEDARSEINTLTGRHLDFYYREVLRLKEKPAEPCHVNLLVELAKHASTHEFKTGELFKAGKDDLGIDAFFANDRNFVANQAKVTALKTVYRHDDEKIGIEVPTDKHKGRIYASPVANSDDGLGAQLMSVDKSWHPFYNKNYQNGVLAEIRMPKAEVGFAIASHYLWMAAGTRIVNVFIASSDALLVTDSHAQITCLFSTAEGWLEKNPTRFVLDNNVSAPQLQVTLAGNDPAITPYNPKLHGYDFATNLPMMLVKIKHTADPYLYPLLQNAKIAHIKLAVDVDGLKTLAVTNDFGPVDTAKPFQPFGALSLKGSSLVIGSQELFQKHCNSVELTIKWQVQGISYSALPSGDIRFLNNGSWSDPPVTRVLFSSDTVTIILDNFNQAVIDTPNFGANSFYQTHSNHGFVRIALNGDFGQAAYQSALITYLIGQTKKPPEGTVTTPIPQIPVAEALSIHYVTKPTLIMDNSLPDSYAQRSSQFFHLAPFGQTEQHPWLKKTVTSLDSNTDSLIYLLPQFYHQQDVYDAEFYIGISGLNPPQSLALLFQVVDGTANPLSEKPPSHIHWSYLQGNEWTAFAKNEVEDQTGGLLNSGIITFAMPRNASGANSLLPAGMHWIRAAVATKSDAVCRLLMVSAQALNATFKDQGNDPAFPAKILAAGAISKLDQPDADIKKITQPYASYGGRGAEAATEFYTRISERLRHKDRAIALWDYERLVLEAFPQIYKAKCLNHTLYEPNESGTGSYKELAAGHITIVTIPDQRVQNLRDPLRPYTSLGVLKEIEAFLKKRLSCFAILHVKNPEFEEVHVDFNVRLYDGFDETFYVKNLQEAITRFLSPWAFSEGVSPSFGGKIYKSALINFVEEQPYVDYVTDFCLFHHVNGEIREQTTEVEGSKAVSILVSVPATKHKITPIKPAEAEASHENCRCET